MPYTVSSRTIVNTTIENRQSASSAAQLGAGGHVVVWSSAGQDGFGYGVYAQRFDATGARLGPETRVNTVTDHSQVDPQVIGLASGGYVVVWRTDVAGTTETRGVFAQTYDASGAPVGGETRITAAGSNYRPVAVEDGGYVIVWESRGAIPTQLFSQRFDAAGNAVGVTRELASDVSTAYAGVAPFGTGFIATWRGFEAGQGHTHVQAFTADGTQVGPAFRIASSTDTGCEIARLADGGYVAVWRQGSALKFQLLGADGVPVGDIQSVAAAPAGIGLLPAVSATVGGGFLVAWTRFEQGSDTGGVFARAFDRAGRPDGDVQTLYSSRVTGGDPPAIAVSPTGTVTVSYTVYSGDTPYFEVYQARLEPTAVSTEGDDTFVITSVPVGGTTTTTIDGLGGTDTADFRSISSGLNFTGSPSELRVGDLSLVNIERILLGSGNDRLPDLGAPGYNGTYPGYISYIDGGAGNDVIRAGNNATLLGGDGDDSLTGGAEAYGGAGNDLISSLRAYGGAGDDTIVYSSQLIVAEGGEGSDTLSANLPYTGGTPDYIDLARGLVSGRAVQGLATIENVSVTLNNRLVFVTGANAVVLNMSVSVYGNGGDNVISINGNFQDSYSPFQRGGGSSTVWGGAGNDRLTGVERTSDVFHGEAGNDILDGGGGNDQMFGGDGDDFIFGYAGPGRYDGGTGTDTLSFERSSSGATLDLTTNGSGIEIVQGSAFGDILGGDQRGNVLRGGAGDDFIAARGGDDTIDGGDGNDRVSAGNGQDSVDGGAGVDVLLLDRDASLFTVNRTSDGYRVTFDGGTTTVRNVERVSFDQGRTSMSFAEFESQTFDPYAYLVANQDLLPTLGYDATALRAHYFSTGAAQGRQIGGFDALTYIASNFDLVRAFGTDARRAAEHYIVAGQNEGRSTSAFNALGYLASNTDLLAAFGGDVQAATRHYIGAGFYEGRSTSVFDGLVYIASNPDLARELSLDPLAATLHYINAGFAERRPTASFDALQYLASNYDLAMALGANASAGVLHYLANGIGEGRATNIFDARLYAATWTDLARAFGTDQQAARLHYLNNGADEGRVTTGFDPVAYLLSNPDLAGLTLDQALNHWLSNGADEGRTGDSAFGRDQSDHRLSPSTTAAFETASDQDWFERSFSAGERVTFSVSGAPATYALFDGAGRPVAPVAGQPGVFDITTSGTYYLAVSSASGPGGTYTVTFTRALTSPRLDDGVEGKAHDHPQVLPDEVEPMPFETFGWEPLFGNPGRSFDDLAPMRMVWTTFHEDWL